MKKIFILVFFAMSFLSYFAADAQSFSKWKDTVSYTYTPGDNTVSIWDSIINPGAFNVTLRWSVIACNFPANWLSDGSIGVCDNMLCTDLTGGGLWPGGNNRTSNAYLAHKSNGAFDLQINLPVGSTSGTYYLTAKMVNASSGGDSTTATFAVTYAGSAAVPTINRNVNNVSLYPNPATNEMNLIYDANADVKNISVYSIIGRVMQVYKVSGNSANLNLENVPAGIYFARLINSNGEVVATRKFTKE